MRRIVKRLKIGFTLPELMATLLIMGILISVAVPTYRDYQIRAKLVDAITTLDGLLDQARQGYISSQTIPSSIKGISSGSATAYSGSKCVDYVYYDDGASWANAGHAAMVQAIIKSDCGQGIKGFEAGTSGAYNTITMGFVAVGDHIQQYCGSWVDDGTQVPLKYLPSGCQSDAFSTLVTG